MPGNEILDGTANPLARPADELAWWAGWKRRKATEWRRKGIQPYAASTHFSLAFTGNFFPNIRDCFLRTSQNCEKSLREKSHSIFLVLYVEHCFRFDYVQLQPCNHRRPIFGSLAALRMKLAIPTQPNLPSSSFLRFLLLLLLLLLLILLKKKTLHKVTNRIHNLNQPKRSRTTKKHKKDNTLVLLLLLLLVLFFFFCLLPNISQQGIF